MNSNVPDTAINNLVNRLLYESAQGNWPDSEDVETIYRDLARAWFLSEPADAYLSPDLSFPANRLTCLDALHQIFQRHAAYGEDKRTAINYEVDRICRQEVAAYRTGLVLRLGQPCTPPSPSPPCRGRSHSPASPRGRSYSYSPVRPQSNDNVPVGLSWGSPRSSSVNRVLFRQPYPTRPIPLEQSPPHPRPPRPRNIFLNMNHGTGQGQGQGTGNPPPQPTLQTLAAALQNLQHTVQ